MIAARCSSGAPGLSGAAVAGPRRCGVVILWSGVSLGGGRGGRLSAGAMSLAGARAVCRVLVVSAAGFSRRFGP